MTTLRGDTPKHKEIVKKCVFNYKVSMKREGRSRGGLRKNRSPAAVPATRPRYINSGCAGTIKTEDTALPCPLYNSDTTGIGVNGCLAWAIKLCRQQLIGQFRIGAATGFLHHLADKKA